MLLVRVGRVSVMGHGGRPGWVVCVGGDLASALLRALGLVTQVVVLAWAGARTVWGTSALAACSSGVLLGRLLSVLLGCISVSAELLLPACLVLGPVRGVVAELYGGVACGGEVVRV